LSDIEHIAQHFDTLSHTDTDVFQTWQEQVIRYQKATSPTYGAFHGFTYLPIQAFKKTTVCCFDHRLAECVFRSSGTSSDIRSVHYVRYAEMYERAILSGFTRVFGNGPFVILAHLPAYRKDSSLVYMAEVLIRELGCVGSGLFLDDHSVLHNGIASSLASGNQLILLGAAFGLLDLVDDRHIGLPHGSLVIETGGMKTHRKSIGRAELHSRLSAGFEIPKSDVKSEYGMCELLSQCYTNEFGFFEAPPWVRVEVLDSNDFKTPLGIGKPGVLAIFDMANVFSQSAILTQDVGVLHEHGFEILGRLEQAEIRGCNLLLEN